MLLGSLLAGPSRGQSMADRYSISIGLAALSVRAFIAASDRHLLLRSISAMTPGSLASICRSRRSSWICINSCAFWMRGASLCRRALIASQPSKVLANIASHVLSSAHSHSSKNSARAAAASSGVSFFLKPSAISSYLSAVGWIPRVATDCC